MRKKTLVIVLGLGGLLLCVICAVWLVIPPPPLEKESWPSWSPDGQYLAYECYLEGPTAGVFESNQRYFTDDAADICVISSDGRNRVRLTKDPGPDQRPLWSPDGSQIAYFRHDGIYVITPDGSNKRRLINQPPVLEQEVSLAWSPDGQHLLFAARLESSDADIYLMNVHTGALTNLTANDGRSDFAPRWTLNGTKVVFSSIVTMPDNVRYQMKIVKVDDNDTDVVLDNGIIYLSRSVSNIGQIALTINDLTQNYDDHLYIMELEGKEPVEIAQIGGTLSWSPDGRYLAVGDQSLMLLDLNEKTSRELGIPSFSSGKGYVKREMMSWSPDSQQVAATIEFPGNYPNEHIYIFNIQDGSVRPLVPQK